MGRPLNSGGGEVSRLPRTTLWFYSARSPTSLSLSPKRRPVERSSGTEEYDGGEDNGLLVTKFVEHRTVLRETAPCTPLMKYGWFRSAPNHPAECRIWIAANGLSG